MQVPVIDCKPGAKLHIDNDLWVVVDYFHGRTAQRRANVRIKIKNLKTGRVLEKTFLSHDKVERVTLENRKMQFLYGDGQEWHFMDIETFEQTAINEEAIGDAKDYLTENMQVDIQYFGGKPVGIDIPTSVVLKIVETEPGVKGDTVSNVTKPATCETGLVVQVPLFVNQGEKIIVDTRTGEYTSRA